MLTQIRKLTKVAQLITAEGDLNPGHAFPNPSPLHYKNPAVAPLKATCHHSQPETSQDALFKLLAVCTPR